MRAAPTGLAVYDGAFSPAAGKRLADTDIRTLGSYRRSRGAHTATEHFIESLLHELGEACDEVEYWGRESWRPVPAHADIDERCARERGQLRFPAAVLVAYVQVEPGLRAPTMLWAELPGGAPVLCAVPAVPGRLLRFDGEMLHAVPQPLTQHLAAAAASAQAAAQAAVQAAVQVDHAAAHVEGELAAGAHVDTPTLSVEEGGGTAAVAVERDGGQATGEDDGAAAERRVLIVNCWDRAPDDNAPLSAAPTPAAPAAGRVSVSPSARGVASSAARAYDAAGTPDPHPDPHPNPHPNAAGTRCGTRCEPRRRWLPLVVERCRTEGEAVGLGLGLGLGLGSGLGSGLHRG